MLIQIIHQKKNKAAPTEPGYEKYEFVEVSLIL
jgi:hypothetical protein